MTVSKGLVATFPDIRYPWQHNSQIYCAVRSKGLPIQLLPIIHHVYRNSCNCNSNCNRYPHFCRQPIYHDLFSVNSVRAAAMGQNSSQIMDSIVSGSNCLPIPTPALDKLYSRFLGTERVTQSTAMR